MVQKETLQVLRDKKMLIQIFVPPVMQLLILAQAMTFEVRHVDMVVVDMDLSPASSTLVENFTATDRFTVARYTHSGAAADEALLTREARMILRIPEGFERDLRRGQSPTLQLIMDAEDGAAAGIVLGWAQSIVNGYAARDGMRLTGAPVGTRAGPGLTVTSRRLYNPEGKYLAYMAIGLLASLMTLVGVLLTSQNIAREKEIGTLEQLNVTPITKREFMLGKLIPFWLLGLIELTIGLGVIRFLFGIPFEGAVTLIYLAAAVYLIAALGLGLFVSTISSTQQQAQFITFFVLVTFFFMGGIFTPVESMPTWAQMVAELNPIKHFAVILRGVLMKGATLADIVRPMLSMAGFAVFVLLLAVRRYRKTA